MSKLKMRKLFLNSLVILLLIIGCFVMPNKAEAITTQQVQNAQQMVLQPKCNLQFTSEVREHFISQCGFTDEEAEIFRMRARGFSLVQISIKTGYSEATVQGRIRKIKRKILAI